ncbi:MAG TPA: hypothetical protein PKI23_02940 [Pseudomonadales bacterium]|jgi:hypothetical protein|nr:hypothetical protein [Pseudomonadales bacterium]HNN35929.1 hypothetical protein [Pseudomonadales bacterium]HNV53974.1 hypothetical protein [Pseudomonadales bacterium]
MAVAPGEGRQTVHERKICPRDLLKLKSSLPGAVELINICTDCGWRWCGTGIFWCFCRNIAAKSVWMLAVERSCLHGSQSIHLHNRGIGKNIFLFESRNRRFFVLSRPVLAEIPTLLAALACRRLWVDWFRMAADSKQPCPASSLINPPWRENSDLPSG